MGIDIIQELEWVEQINPQEVFCIVEKILGDNPKDRAEFMRRIVQMWTQKYHVCRGSDEQRHWEDRQFESAIYGVTFLRENDERGAVLRVQILPGMVWFNLSQPWLQKDLKEVNDSLEKILILRKLRRAA